MSWIKISQVTSIFAGEGKNVPETTVLYAANCGHLRSKTVNGEVFVNREQIDYKVANNVPIPPLTMLIKKDLQKNGIAEPEWEENWLEDEDPMTDEEFLEYERKRIARMAFKPVQRKIW